MINLESEQSKDLDAWVNEVNKALDISHALADKMENDCMLPYEHCEHAWLHGDEHKQKEVRNKLISSMTEPELFKRFVPK